LTEADNKVIKENQKKREEAEEKQTQEETEKLICEMWQQNKSYTDKIEIFETDDHKEQIMQ